MDKLENLEVGKSVLYSEGHFSDKYDQKLFLLKTKEDTTNKHRYYLNIFTSINGTLVCQGFIYFYLDEETRTSDFIGIGVKPEYRNLNIGSFLVASWINLCFDNGYNFLGANEKQRKPFLLYLLKTYGFEIFDKTLYDTRSDVISICRSKNEEDNQKLLLFKSEKHEQTFLKTNVYNEDNYKIIHNSDNIIILDSVILPLQSMKRNSVKYTLLDRNLAKKKTKNIIYRHQR